VELGNMIVALLDNKKLQTVRGALVWALGRLGQRVPVYGPLNTVVPHDRAAAWLKVLLSHTAADPLEQLAVMQLARRTGDRHRDLPDAVREEALAWFARQSASAHLRELVREGGRLDDQEQGQIVGESLPKGLRIRRP